MIEYRDGSTSETGELDEMLSRVRDEAREMDDDTPLSEIPESLHMGSREELQSKREKKDRLDELEDQVDDLKSKVDRAQSPRGSRRVKAPNPEEVHAFSEQNLIQ